MAAAARQSGAPAWREGDRGARPCAGPAFAEGSHMTLQRLKRGSLVFVALLSSGCWAQRLNELAARASYDLGCPQVRLEFTELGRRESQGVSGCGRRATYVLVESGGG